MEKKLQFIACFNVLHQAMSFAGQCNRTDLMVIRGGRRGWFYVIEAKYAQQFATL